MKEPDYVHFEVPGAGVIRMSRQNAMLCGGRTGYDFGVSWGKYGFIGGVLPIEEAKKLAEFILETIKA